MKQIFLMAVASLIMITGAQAQHQKQNKTSDQKKEWRSQGNMNLTQEQKDQMQKLRDEAKKEREQIKNDKSLTDAQRSEKVKELQKNQREKMNALLTSEQRETMKNNRGQMRKSERPERKAGQNNAMKQRMGNQYAKLDLSQTQKDQLRKISEDNKAKRDAIKNDSKLTNEQRMEKMKELNAESKKQRDAVFTKEQRDQLKAMKGDRQAKGKKPAYRKQQPAKK